MQNTNTKCLKAEFSFVEDRVKRWMHLMKDRTEYENILKRKGKERVIQQKNYWKE